MHDLTGLFQELAALYSTLDSEVKQAPQNPCGTCRECCTTNSLNKHYVTQLEIGFIRDRVGGERLEEFKKFLDRDKDTAICPYFDENLWGCGIYDIRPYSCRVYGHFRVEETRLPTICVFKGQEKIFGVGEYLDVVPQATEFRLLLRKYWPYQQGEEDAVKAFGGDPDGHSAQGDDLDRAMFLQESGRLDEALKTLEASQLDRNPHFLYCQALILEGLGRFVEACEILSAATVEAPQSVLLAFRYGCNLFHSQRPTEAVAAFLRTLELNPNHPTALGLLGAHSLQTGDFDQARDFLQRALEIQPDNPSIKGLLTQIPPPTTN